MIVDCNTGKRYAEERRKLGILKFIAHIGKDGFPLIVPQLAAACVDSGRVYLPGVEYREELAAVPDGSREDLSAAEPGSQGVLGLN